MDGATSEIKAMTDRKEDIDTGGTSTTGLVRMRSRAEMVMTYEQHGREYG
jgi:hypothetical protein